jgi:soluble lytic murein transglycosylase-like protein
MNFGQRLSRAGDIVHHWREAEDAQRRSRQIQLETDQLNRLDRFRQEQLRAGTPQASPPPPIPLDRFGDLGIIPVESIEPPVSPAAPAPRADGAFLGEGALSSVDSWNRSFGRPAQQQAPAQPTSRVDQSIYNNISEVVRMREMRITDMERGLQRLEEGGGSARMIANQRERIAAERKLLDAAKSGQARVGGEVEASQEQLRERITPTPQLPNSQQLLTAMIQVESSGRPNAVSGKGATGLMQVMPATAMRPGFGLPNVFDFAQQMGAEVKGRSRSEAERLLKDPEIGAAYGQQYMQAMLQRYNGNLGFALVAYNWGPSNADRWIADGADFNKLPKETREYVPKVIGLLNPMAPEMPLAAGPGVQPDAAPAAGLNMPGAAPAQAAQTPTAAASTAATSRTQDGALRVEQGGVSQYYLANPRSIPLDMQRAMQMRGELEQLAGMYQRAGLGNEYTTARLKLMEVDNNMTYLHGMQGLQELTLANDPRRLAAVWSQYAGMPVGIQPRSDGAFNILVNGQKVKEGISQSEIANTARLSFDAAFRQQQAAASAEANKESFKSRLKQLEENGKQIAQMIREVAVKRVEGQNQLDLERLKQFKYDVRATGEPGHVIITPPGGAPYFFNASGRSITMDGVTITSQAAYPIAGLPTYGGTRPQGTR